MDGIGGRLTNSHSLRPGAEDWALAKFRGYGLGNVHREPLRVRPRLELQPKPSAHDFARGRSTWSCIPVAWTPGTNGAIRAPIVVAPIDKPEHFAAYRGKLAGKIVLVSLPGTQRRAQGGRLQAPDRQGHRRRRRLQPAELRSRRPRPPVLKRVQFAKQLDEFLKSEGAVAWVRKSYREGKLVTGEGYSYLPAQRPSLPGFELAAEDYRRLTRLAKLGPAPGDRAQQRCRLRRPRQNANNIIAEIPGTDPKAGYVMAGAHFDSWIAADGASDNGAGSMVVMEAARILRQLGVRPKRTIRFALWEGEEQGLLGSRAYLQQHLVDRPTPPAWTA